MLEVGFLTGSGSSTCSGPPAMPCPIYRRHGAGRKGVELLRFGHRIPADPPADGMAKAVGPDGDLLAILEAADDGASWHPRKVFLG